VVGWVYQDGDAYAAYYAGWTEGHVGSNLAIIIGIGPWDDLHTAADRRSFGLDCWEEAEEVRFSVIEPEQSRYGTSRVLGAMMPRQAALADSELPEIFHVAEHIVREDPRVVTALASLRTPA
jgi:hypothetical protein